MKEVYFISGLGADKRAFSLLDLSFCQPVFIDWIPPQKAESLAHYALRLKEQLPAGDTTIVGLSFGGMLATEMAKADPHVRAIIISSNKTFRELPLYFRAGKYFPVYRWLPRGMLKKTAVISQWMLGAKGPAQQQLFRRIVADSDPAFTKWAIDAILHWQNREVPKNLVHIHGTADKLLPFRLVKADYAIKGGTHITPMDHAAELSALLKKLVSATESHSRAQ